MAYPSVAMPYMDQGGFAPLGDSSADDRAEDAEKYLRVLAEERLLWEPAIDNLITYVNPGRRLVQEKNTRPGQLTGMEIYDDTAVLALNMLVDGMVGYLCSRNQPWFALGIPGKLNFPRSSSMRGWSGKSIDSYPEVQAFIQDSQDVMYSAFNRSNFYDIVTEFIRDGASTGTAHFLMEEDLAAARIVFTVPHFRECFVATNRFGRVDTNYRVYKMTLRQFVQQFGMAAMIRADQNFEQDYKQNMHAEREVLHAIYPRRDVQPWRIDAKGKKWASDWIYRKGGKILNNSGDQRVSMLSEGGYDSMPVLTWRWRVNSDEVYGRGPAHDAWTAIALANQMGRTNLVTAQKAAEPPLVAYSDMRGQIQRGPNGITFMESNRGDIRARAPIPLLTGTQSLPFSTEYQEKVKQIINQHFHTDVFMMISQIGQEKGMGRPVTEQINEMQNEKAAILGTRIGNLQSEGFDPLIARVYDIEARAGRIPEPPQILLESQHGGVVVQYVGMLAQAQTRVTKIRAIQTSVSLLTQLTQFDPLATHVINTDEMGRDIMDAAGMPVKDVFPPKHMEQVRQMAQQQQEKQQQIDNAPKIAKAAALAGKSSEQDSPLRMLMGGGKAPGE